MQPKAAFLCMPHGTAAAQPMVVWVCSRVEPPENGTTPKQFLKLSTHFVSSLVRTGRKVPLQRQLLTWPSFQAQCKQDKPDRGRRSLCLPSGCSRNHHSHLAWGRELLYPKITPWYPQYAPTAPPAPSAPHPSLLGRTTSSSLQIGVSGPASPEGWPPFIHLYCLDIH